MRHFVYASAMALADVTAMAAPASATVGLEAYVDENGYIEVQTLTCDQLANTYQEYANALANGYSG